MSNIALRWGVNLLTGVGSVLILMSVDLESWMNFTYIFLDCQNNLTVAQGTNYNGDSAAV
jgi:hypothetical protein